MTEISYIMAVACSRSRLLKFWFRAKLITGMMVCGNRHRLCVNRRVVKGRTYKRKRLRKSDIEFLWTQVQDVIEHGNNKDAKTRLELLQRIYQLLAKTSRKNK